MKINTKYAVDNELYKFNESKLNEYHTDVDGDQRDIDDENPQKSAGPWERDPDYMHLNASTMNRIVALNVTPGDKHIGEILFIYRPKKLFDFNRAGYYRDYDNFLPVSRKTKDEMQKFLDSAEMQSMHYYNNRAQKISDFKLKLITFQTFIDKIQYKKGEQLIKNIAALDESEKVYETSFDQLDWKNGSLTGNGLKQAVDMFKAQDADKQTVVVYDRKSGKAFNIVDAILGNVNSGHGLELDIDTSKEIEIKERENMNKLNETDGEWSLYAKTLRTYAGYQFYVDVHPNHFYTQKAAEMWKRTFEAAIFDALEYWYGQTLARDQLYVCRASDIHNSKIISFDAAEHDPKYKDAWKSYQEELRANKYHAADGIGDDKGQKAYNALLKSKKAEISRISELDNKNENESEVNEELDGDGNEYISVSEMIEEMHNAYPYNKEGGMHSQIFAVVNGKLEVMNTVKFLKAKSFPDSGRFILTDGSSASKAAVEKLAKQLGVNESDLNEADDREPLSHALDAVGVKASTADSKAQDEVQMTAVTNDTYAGIDVAIDKDIDAAMKNIYK